MHARPGGSTMPFFCIYASIAAIFLGSAPSPGSSPSSDTSWPLGIVAACNCKEESLQDQNTVTEHGKWIG